jgi:hypothetical protein
MDTEPGQQSTVDAIATTLMETSDVAFLMLSRLDPHDAAMAAAIGEMLGGAAVGLLDLHERDQPAVTTIPVPDEAGLLWLRDMVEHTERLVRAYIQADPGGDFDQTSLLIQDVLRWVHTAHALAVHWIPD